MKRKLMTEKAKEWLCALLVYALVYTVLALAWVGAEYLIDGAVVASKVDAGVNAILAFFITQHILTWEAKIVQATRKGGHRVGGDGYA